MAVRTRLALLFAMLTPYRICCAWVKVAFGPGVVDLGPGHVLVAEPSRVRPEADLVAGFLVGVVVVDDELANLVNVTMSGACAVAPVAGL